MWRSCGLLVVLSLVLGFSALGKSKLPIRQFLEGYTVLETTKGKVSVPGYREGGEFYPGMGIENPGLAKLMSLAHGALGAIYSRVLTGKNEWTEKMKTFGFTQTENSQLLTLLSKESQVTAKERTAHANINASSANAEEKKKKIEALASQRLTENERATLTALLRNHQISTDAEASLRENFKYLHRSSRQYALAWRLMGEVVRRSLSEFDLRGYADKKLVFKGGTEQQKTQADLALKKYVVDKAGELYVGALKFLSLRPNPVPGHNPARLSAVEKDAAREETDLEASDLEEQSGDPFAWLDWEEFDLKNPAQLNTFLFANSDQIPYYANQELIPNARLVAEGFKGILHKANGNSALMKMNLNQPSPDERKALAEQVLGTKSFGEYDARKTAGLVTFYLHCIGAVVDGFNVNTHDSFEIMRTSLYTLFQHVLDMDAHESWAQDASALRKVVEFRPFPIELPTFFPVKEVIQRVQDRRWQIYLEETKKGPQLNRGDLEQRTEEFRQYHGDLIRQVFGSDYSHYVWPMNKRFSDKDVRITSPLPPAAWMKDKQGKPIPEVRLPNGEPLPESRAIQSGDVWAELGTGMGSQLIAMATDSSTPNDRVKKFIATPSVWNVATEKLYNRWANAIGWAAGLVENYTGYDLVPAALQTSTPGAGIDYNGFSHVGLVERFSDPTSAIEHTDFIDAFPNRMRQAWRGHGWGSNHARLGAIFRLRPEIAEEYVREFDTKYAALSEELEGKAWNSLSEDMRERLRTNRNDKESLYYLCKEYLTHLEFTDFDNIDRFTAQRVKHKPNYEYCMKVFQRRGMDNFKAKILDQGGATWEGERLVRVMGTLSVDIGRGIRNQHREFLGFGHIFDDRFDSMTKGMLYCSEFAQLTWMLGTGLNVWQEASFTGLAKLGLQHLTEGMIDQLTSGFRKVPFTKHDTVYAPQDIMLTDFGRKHWKAVVVAKFTFFAPNDE